MRRRVEILDGRCAALLLLWVATVCGAREDSERYLPPRALRLSLSRAELTCDGEESMERVTSSESGTVYEERYRSLSPAMSLRARGSVYHPYFLTFDAGGQYGPSWTQRASRSGDIGGDLAEEDTSAVGSLSQYDANAAFFKRKPYASALFAGRSTTLQEYDFFTRSTVENTRYGGRSGYSRGRVPFSLSLERSLNDERTLDERDLSREETTLTLKARNERTASDDTTLDYALHQFRYFDEQATLGDGLRHSLIVFDRQTLTADKSVRLQSGLLYNRLDSLSLLSSSLALQEQLRMTHTPDLNSEYRYRFSDQVSDSAGTRSHQAEASLTHQLYESLTSRLGTDGAVLQNTGAGTAGDSIFYGGSVGEAYTKSIPADGRLSLDGSAQYHVENGETEGGDSTAVIDEAHVLSGTDIVFLNRPDVDPASITVTDPTGTRRYEEGLDYAVIRRGDGVEIQRIFGGTIPEGESVLVDYTAGSLSAADYATLARTLNGRMNLFDDFLSLYGKVYTVSQVGGTAVNVVDILDRSAGVDLRIRWLSLGASYRVYDSTVVSYTSAGYYERLSLMPHSRVTLNLDLDQTATRYEETAETGWVYSFIGRCDVRLLARLLAKAEAGRRLERGPDYDRDLQTLRIGLSYSIGKLALSLRGERTEVADDREEREKQSVMFHAQRFF